MILLAIEKIQFAIFGLELLEPNTFITDTLLGLLCIYYGIKISKLPTTHTFYSNWKVFLILFGIATVLGGIGHTFYNYLGIAGKIPTWVFSVIAVYFVELSMITIHPDESKKVNLLNYSLLKLFLVIALVIVVLTFAEAGNKISLSILIVIINSLVGVTLSAGALGLYYNRLVGSRDFKNFITGVAIMLPSSAIFLFDINIYRWFDKNDLSHLLLGIGITFFYLGILRIFRLTNSEASSLHPIAIKG